MAYTKYSLTPANNNAAPPDGAPEGMLPSAVNDTMRDMMAQIRDCGDGIRGGTYTMTAPVITGGSINGAAIGASTASTGAFTTLAYSSTFTGGTGVINIGSNQFYKDSNGNIGLGVVPSVYTASAKTLQIDGGANAAQIRLTNNTTGSSQTNGGLISIIGNDFALWNVENAALQFGTDDTERMRLNSLGSLYIGTSTSSNGGAVKLSLYGGTSGGAATGIQFGYAGGTYGGGGIFALNQGGGLQFYTYTGNQGSEVYTERMSISNAGNNLVLSGGTVNAPGTGITFPSSQVASTDANCLDDYEEGTWTPTIQGSSTAGTASYTTRNAKYTKIGRLVQIETYINWTGGTGAGDMRIGGLPFTSGTGQTFPAVSVSYAMNIALTANNVISAYISDNSTFITISQSPVGGGSAGVVAYDGAGEIIICGTYSV